MTKETGRKHIGLDVGGRRENSRPFEGETFRGVSRRIIEKEENAKEGRILLRVG